MDKRFPAVSVIISTYNRPEFLDRALESVCAQDFEDFDVWVVDDHSPDEKPVGDVLEKWFFKFKERGIELWAVRLAENTGYQCVPKNIGITQCDGDYIAYLDDDNTWTPDHLSVLFDAIIKDDVDMVYGGRRYINNTEHSGLAEGDAPAQPWRPEILDHQNFVDTSDMLHTKGGAYMMAGMDGQMWDENLLRFGDWNFVHRWAKHGLTAAPVDAIITNYYWHGGNLQLTRKVTESPISLSLNRAESMLKS